MAGQVTVRVEFAGEERRNGEYVGTPAHPRETSVPEWGYNE